MIMTKMRVEFCGVLKALKANETDHVQIKCRNVFENIHMNRVNGTSLQDFPRLLMLSAISANILMRTEIACQ